MTNNLEKIAKHLRYLVLKSTTKARSGHPTSCLSSVELMTGLMFGGFYQKSDHLIFSKGHAAPLLYSIYTELGQVKEQDLMTLRQFNSLFEGHPMPGLPFIEAATGSLGQGLSIGVGMAINDKLIDKTSHRTYVLLGDGELAEGSNWEAIGLASHYQLNNLTAIVDVNRLEQDGATAMGWDLAGFQKKFSAFGWQATIVKNGHDFTEIQKALALENKDNPQVILAKTIKGKGVSFLENRDNWHGKTLSEKELTRALSELAINDDKVNGLLDKLDHLSKHA